jgi:hypothetical protein
MGGPDDVMRDDDGRLLCDICKMVGRLKEGLDRTRM